MMAEPDVFERRLRAALLRHVDAEPAEFDALRFAREVAAREPRSGGLGGILGRHWVVLPHVAWVLLLVAFLITALVGGALVVGSQLQRRLPAVVPPVGRLFECPPGSNPDAPGPADQARPAFADMATFDRRAGRLVAVTGTGTDVQTWTFDVCTNIWTRMHPNREPSRVESRPLAYDIDSDVTILISSGRVWAYDLQADTWTENGTAPSDPTPWAYDPRSGLVVAGNLENPEELWTYDVGTDTWTPIHQANAPGNMSFSVAAYDASVDRIIGYAGGNPSAETWLVDIPTGTWSRSHAETPVVIAGFGWQAPTIEYDEAARRTVVFGNGMALYDATADRWVTLDAAAAGRPDIWPVSMVYDPVNERLVGCSWPALGERQADVVAFDLATREWTVLLEAGREPATP